MTNKTNEEIAREIVSSWQSECLYVGVKECVALSHLEDKIKEALREQAAETALPSELVETAIYKLKFLLRDYPDDKQCSRVINDLSGWLRDNAKGIK